MPDVGLQKFRFCGWQKYGKLIECCWCCQCPCLGSWSGFRFRFCSCSGSCSPDHSKCRCRWNVCIKFEAVRKLCHSSGSSRLRQTKAGLLRTTECNADSGRSCYEKEMQNCSLFKLIKVLKLIMKLLKRADGRRTYRYVKGFGQFICKLLARLGGN